MKGLIILVFFSIFAGVSLLIPAPMFPGSWFCSLIGQEIQGYVTILSAVFNGIIYGSILWLIFNSIIRKLTE